MVSFFDKIFGFLQTLLEPVFAKAKKMRGGTCAKLGVWMMAMTSFRQLSLLVAAGFALTACGSESVSPEEMMRVAQKFKISERERPAFKACVKTSEGNAPYVKVGVKMMLLASVPAEMCGCQTKVIAQTFTKEKVEAYGTFVAWATKPARKSGLRFAKDTFGKDVDNKRIRDKLVASLDSCALQFAKANEEQANALLTPYVDPAQLKKEAAEKKKKDAEAKAKAEAEAAKKSET